MKSQSVEEWIRQTKIRHQKCLSWQSNGRAALALVVNPVQKQPPLEEWYSNEKVIFEYESIKLRNMMQVQSDILPVIHCNFNAAAIFSLFGATVGYHENGPVYHPFFTDVEMIDKLEVPEASGGLMPLILKSVRYCSKNAPAYVNIAMPFHHSPLDTAALLRGAEVFYLDCILEKERMKKLLSVITEAFIQAENYLNRSLNRTLENYINTHGIYFGNMIEISDDCCVNLGPDLIRELDMYYLKQISKRLNINLCTHYCVLNDNQGNHCIDPMLEASYIKCLNNQYSPEYFSSNYKRFENKLALIHSGSIMRFGETADQRIENFKVWAKEYLHSFKGKSGLILYLSVPAIEEAKEIFEIWDSINRWSEIM